MDPVPRVLDEVFRSDRSVGWKMGGCALATMFLVVSATLREIAFGDLNVTPTPTLIAALAGVAALVGAFLGMALALKDVVRRRVGRGDRVDPLLKLSFGGGVWSLVAWFPTILLAGFVITMLTL